MRPIICISLFLMLAIFAGCSKRIVVIKANPTVGSNNGPMHTSKDNIQASDNHLAQAKKFYARAKYKQSIKQCEKALQFNRRNWEAIYYLGLSMQKRKEYSISIEMLGAGLKYCPDNRFIKSEIHFAIGISWEKLEHYSNANKEYNIALEHNPGNSYARDAKNRLVVNKTMKNWRKNKNIPYDG